MIKPIRDFIVVSKNEASKQSAGGIFLAPSDEKVVMGTVMEVGSGLIAGDGSIIPLEIKKGDKVAFNKSMAVEVKDGAENYLVLREEHILCVVS